MRLDDMSFTDYLTAEFDLKERQRKERMKQAEFEKYAKEHNLFVCSTNVLEQIRTDVEKIMSIDLDMNSEHSKVEARSMAIVLEIIDKYMKGESNG